MGTKQNKPPKSDTPTEHYSITLESIRTKRHFGVIILTGVFLFFCLLLITIILTITYDFILFEKLIQYILNHWGTFSSGFIIGVVTGKIPQAFKYLVNE